MNLSHKSPHSMFKVLFYLFSKCCCLLGGQKEDTEEEKVGGTSLLNKQNIYTK